MKYIRTQIPLSEIPQEKLNQLIDNLRNTSRLAGTACPGNPPILVFKIAAELEKHLIRGDQLSFMLVECKGYFGSGIQVIVRLQNIETISHVIIAKDSDVFRDLFQQRRYRGVLAAKDRPISAFLIDYTEANNRSDITIGEVIPAFNMSLEQYLNSVKIHSPIVSDAAAYYWECLGSLWKLGIVRNLTSEERLSIGWVSSYGGKLKKTAVFLKEVKSGVLSLALAGLNETTIEFLKPLREFDGEIRQILSWLSGDIHERNGDLTEYWRAWWNIYDVNHESNLLESLRFLLLTCLASPEFTGCGRNLVWLEDALKLRKLALKPTEFRKGFDPITYWPNISDDLCENWGKFIKGSDVPIDLRYASKAWKNTKIDNPAELRKKADDFLTDALINKKWTIPYGAVIDFNVGPYIHMQAFEIGDDIYFLCKSSEGNFEIISLIPNSNFCSFRCPCSEGVIELKSSKVEAVEAAMKFLLAAHIRDFWVVEEREKVFATQLKTTRFPSVKNVESKPLIVYVPRVRYKYTSSPNITKCESDLGYHERRSHWVKEHLRLSPAVSDRQIFLAKRYGIEVPQGYTFISPHERGKKKRDIIYRSRSALQSLYDILEVSSTNVKSSDWFQFEKDVRDVMISLGYDVEHISASKRGDKGVDLYATKLIGDTEEQWIIQCKCWSQNHKIGPSVVREFLGALKPYPSGTRGMIVTTSLFTSEALTLAEETGITLMDGTDFSHCLKTLKNESE